MKHTLTSPLAAEAFSPKVPMTLISPSSSIITAAPATVFVPEAPPLWDDELTVSVAKKETPMTDAAATIAQLQGQIKALQAAQQAAPVSDSR